MAAGEWGLPHAPHAGGQETPGGGPETRRHPSSNHLRPLKRDESSLQQAGDDREVTGGTSDESRQMGADLARVVRTASGRELPQHLRDGTRDTARLPAEEDE